MYNVYTNIQHMYDETVSDNTTACTHTKVKLQNSTHHSFLLQNIQTKDTNYPQQLQLQYTHQNTQNITLQPRKRKHT